MDFKCKQSLYKSTYKKNAFIKGRKYEIVLNDPFGKLPIKDRYGNKLIWIKDENDHPFTFSEERVMTYYVLEDYFINIKQT